MVILEVSPLLDLEMFTSLLHISSSVGGCALVYSQEVLNTFSLHFSLQISYQYWCKIWCAWHKQRHSPVSLASSQRYRTVKELEWRQHNRRMKPIWSLLTGDTFPYTLFKSSFYTLIWRSRTPFVYYFTYIFYYYLWLIFLFHERRFWSADYLFWWDQAYQRDYSSLIFRGDWNYYFRSAISQRWRIQGETKLRSYYRDSEIEQKLCGVSYRDSFL